MIGNGVRQSMGEESAAWGRSVGDGWSESGVMCTMLFLTTLHYNYCYVKSDLPSTLLHPRMIACTEDDGQTATRQ